MKTRILQAIGLLLAAFIGWDIGVALKAQETVVKGGPGYIKPAAEGTDYVSPTTMNSAMASRAPDWSFNSAPGRSIQTTAAAANGWQVSASRPSTVYYGLQTSTTSTISGASNYTAVLQICSTNSSTAANWTEVCRIRNGQTLSVALALQIVQTIDGTLATDVPAGWYVRVLQSASSGTASASIVSALEVTK